jgi:hypothetical protein
VIALISQCDRCGVRTQSPPIQAEDIQLVALAVAAEAGRPYVCPGCHGIRFEGRALAAWLDSVQRAARGEPPPAPEGEGVRADAN